jgi:hypothetical protein
MLLLGCFSVSISAIHNRIWDRQIKIFFIFLGRMLLALIVGNSRSWMKFGVFWYQRDFFDSASAGLSSFAKKDSLTSILSIFPFPDFFQFFVWQCLSFGILQLHKYYLDLLELIPLTHFFYHLLESVDLSIGCKERHSSVKLFVHRFIEF